MVREVKRVSIYNIDKIANEMDMRYDNDTLTFFSQSVTFTETKVPLVTESVAAGFPSPAENYIEDTLDLNKHLIKNPPATFLVRVDGDSMINAGIKPGDMIIVDRSIEAKNNDIIVAIIDGQFTLKTLKRENGSISLSPENPKYKVINITEEMEFEVWGKVVSFIHKF
ncbi:MAG TPA: S24 family peptidase [Victivallales bacterium]|nr:S24 family peptidase [Victivallales bacterium]